MRKLMVLVIMVMSLALLGADGVDSRTLVTGEGWPACSSTGGVKVFRQYVTAIASEDAFVTRYYERNMKCGLMRSGVKAEIVKEAENIILVRVHVEGLPPSEVFMISGSLVPQ